MHTVIESPTVLADCQKAGVSDKDRGMMVSAISNDPKKGDVMPGTGGARKLRFAGRGKASLVDTEPFISMLRPTFRP